MESNNPLISVIISTFNRAGSIEKTIRTVLDQTLQDFEIIIVDDASTDNTLEVLEKLKQKDDRISFYQLEKNSGGAAAPKNKALEHAQGPFIATLDSDDLWRSDKLEAQVSFLKNHTDVSIVGCDFYNIRDGGSEVQKIPDVNHQNAILIKDYMGPGSCFIYRKEVFEKIGMFDPEFKNYQDWDMRIRASQDFRFGFVPEPLVDYIVESDSISTRSRYKIDRYLRMITFKHWRLISKKPSILFPHLFYLFVRHVLTIFGLSKWWLFIRNKVLKNKTF